MVPYWSHSTNYTLRDNSFEVTVYTRDIWAKVFCLQIYMNELMKNEMVVELLIIVQILHFDKQYLCFFALFFFFGLRILIFRLARAST